MTVAATVDAIKTTCEGVEGIVTVFSGDWDAILPDSSTPFAVVKGEFGGGQPLTMGPGGAMLNTYSVTVRLYLGPANIHKEDAHSLMIEMAERFRLAFWTDTTLGGKVLEAFITDATDNLDDFEQSDPPDDLPRVDITFRVREVQQYNA